MEKRLCMKVQQQQIKIKLKPVSQFTGNISTTQLSLDSALFIVLKKKRNAWIFAVLDCTWREIRKLRQGKCYLSTCLRNRGTYSV